MWWMGGHEKSGGGLVVEGSWERDFFFPHPHVIKLFS
jgi:hypothetical protein